MNKEYSFYINPKGCEYPTKVVEKPQVVPPQPKPEVLKKHIKRDGKKDKK